MHIGLCGKRRTDRTLTIKRRDGNPFFLHPTYLTYNVDLQGGMFVKLLPFRSGVDSKFVSTVADLIRDNDDSMTKQTANWKTHLCDRVLIPEARSAIALS